MSAARFSFQACLGVLLKCDYAPLSTGDGRGEMVGLLPPPQPPEHPWLSGGWGLVLGESLDMLAVFFLLDLFA